MRHRDSIGTGNDRQRGREHAKRRPIIIEDEEGGHPSRRSPRHDGSAYQQQQLKNQVIQLKQLVRIQNRVIIGLASCFVLVILSTLVLIQNLPHPNDERGPFWEHNYDIDKQHDQTIGQTSSQQRTKHNNQEVLQARNCTKYGCPIRPVEVSQLNSTSTQTLIEIASNNHILITHKSNRKKPAPVNQDRAVLIPSFGYDNDNGRQVNNVLNNQHDNNFIVGIFDGHDDNGHQVAQFASEQIPSRIALKIHNISNGGTNDMNIDKNNMKQIITETFIEVDSEVPITGGGCTANVMLRMGSKLYMANTGDSTSYIAIYTPPTQYSSEKGAHNRKYISSPRDPNIQLQLQGSITIHFQNTKHKANLPTEKARIEGMGGKIHIPPQNPNGSRVIVRSTLHGEDVGLAMSRSLGDWEWTAIGVIPDPDIIVVDLDKFWMEQELSKGGYKVFAVLGSDGLFDARQVKFVANHLAYGLFEYDTDLYKQTQMKKEGDGGNAMDDNKSDNDDEDNVPFSKHLLEVGKKLVNMASPLKEEWYRDDITSVAKVIELWD